RGAARIVPLNATYDAGAAVDPEAQAAVFVAAAETALADGYAGLRVVADCTSLVRTPAALEAFARYEHVVDREMQRQPLAGLCAFDRTRLDDRILVELACLHQETNVDAALFRLHACDPDAGCAALTGELDPSTHELFAQALDRVDPRPVDGRLVLDASGLRYVDHRSLLLLQDFARGRHATAVLR
ncbi:MEDS domain-containing protein, partial [Micromonospora zhanjiangensis]